MTLTRRLPAAAVLVVFWLLLYGEVTLGNIVAGVAVAVGVTIAIPLEPAARTHRVHPIAAVQLVLHFSRLVIVSNIQLVRTIIRPRPAGLRAGIVRMELEPTTPLITTLVANALSLTPGNLTIIADHSGVIHVHILGLTTTEQVRTDIADLHRRIVAALEPRPESRPA